MWDCFLEETYSGTHTKSAILVVVEKREGKARRERGDNGSVNMRQIIIITSFVDDGCHYIFIQVDAQDSKIAFAR